MRSAEARERPGHRRTPQPHSCHVVCLPADTWRRRHGLDCCRGVLLLTKGQAHHLGGHPIKRGHELTPVDWSSLVRHHAATGGQPTQPPHGPCGGASTPEGGSADAPIRAPRRTPRSAGVVQLQHVGRIHIGHISVVI